MGEGGAVQVTQRYQQLNTMIEEYKDVTGYKGIYKVSNTGKVLNIKRGKHISLRKQYGNKRKYVSLSVLLHKKGKGKETMVSRLVAQAFIRKPKHNEEVNHIDLNPQNNNVSNLEWVTHKQNLIHSVNSGSYDHLKIKKEKLDKIISLRKEGKTLREIGDIFNISNQRVGQIISRYPQFF